MTNFRAIYSSDLSHRARVVYMYLADRADRDGKCWPAIKTIAAELNLSRSTVKRALDDLCKAELLTKETRWRENGGLTSNLYRISTHFGGMWVVCRCWTRKNRSLIFMRKLLPALGGGY